MTACSRIEINSTIISRSHATIITGVYSNHVKAFVQFVGRPQLKNGNLWLKAGSCSASSESGAKSQIPYCSISKVNSHCNSYTGNLFKAETDATRRGVHSNKVQPCIQRFLKVKYFLVGVSASVE